MEIILLAYSWIFIKTQGFFWPFGEIFGTDEIGEKLCDLGKKYNNFWKK